MAYKSIIDLHCQGVVNEAMIAAPRTETVQFSFKDQNCVFPIVCVFKDSTPSINYLANGVTVKCDISGLDS